LRVRFAVASGASECPQPMRDYDLADHY